MVAVCTCQAVTTSSNVGFIVLQFPYFICHTVIQMVLFAGSIHELLPGRYVRQACLCLVPESYILCRTLISILRKSFQVGCLHAEFHRWGWCSLILTHAWAAGGMTLGIYCCTLTLSKAGKSCSYAELSITVHTLHAVYLADTFIQSNIPVRIREQAQTEFQQRSGLRALLKGKGVK